LVSGVPASACVAGFAAASQISAGDASSRDRPRTSWYPEQRLAARD